MRKVLLTISAVAMSAACHGGKGWNDVHTVDLGAVPRFEKPPRVAVAPISTVGAKGPGLQPSACNWPTDPTVESCFDTFERQFHSTLRAQDDPNIDAPSSGPADIVVHPQLTFLDPGQCTGKGDDRPSHAEIRVEITDSHGTLIEVLDIESHQPPYTPEPAPGFRVWKDGDSVAAALRKRLRDIASVR